MNATTNIEVKKVLNWCSTYDESFPTFVFLLFCQCEAVGRVADIIQIPAFLCRQVKSQYFSHLEPCPSMMWNFDDLSL